jgi:flagellar biosynthesis protein FlhB
MAEESATGAEKTEPASEKKRSDARNKGSVAKSMDLNSAALLIFGLLILYVGGSALATQLGQMARSIFSNLSHVELNAANAHSFLKEHITFFVITVLPTLVGFLVVGLIANFGQVGFLFTMQPLMPSFGKMNPAAGLKRVLFSKHAVIEIVKGMVKVVLVGLVAYNALKDVTAQSMTLVDSDVGAILEFMAKSAMQVGLKVGLAFFVVAGFDYWFQRFEFEKKLKMTKEEVKQEGKEAEGDPQIKGRIRTIQRQIAYRRMMHDVPTADVVITNPTHFAVAIKYEMGKMGAPKVVAKGADLIAQRIKEIAKENDVPIVEDKPLAQMLYKTVDIGEEIPEKLFQAVAQVLAFVFRLRDARQHKLSMN